MKSKTLILVIFIALVLVSSQSALACFGARLKVGVHGASELKMAAYSLGYFIEEKTGIEPDFVDITAPMEALGAGKVDILLVLGESPVPRIFSTRRGGKVPVIGEALGASEAPELELRVVLLNDLLDDLRFTTVDKSLALLPDFYASAVYRKASAGNNASAGNSVKGEEKKLARKAVADGT
jgi:hypothetical protein